MLLKDYDDLVEGQTGRHSRETSRQGEYDSSIEMTDSIAIREWYTRVSR